MASLPLGCDAAIICVPTPLNKTQNPAVRYHAPCAPTIRHTGCELTDKADLDAALRLGSG
jgi:hypothetical protein